MTNPILQAQHVKDSEFIRSSSISEILNIVGLFGISTALIIAFYYQFHLHESPCPLCLLQRIGMIAIGIGFLMNIRFGIRSAHYGGALLGSLLTGAIAMRQVFLHILPGDAGYGSSFFNLHFYTWAALSALAAIFFISALLIIKTYEKLPENEQPVHAWGKVAIGIFTALIAANLISVFFECGVGQCH